MSENRSAGEPLPDTKKHGKDIVPPPAVLRENVPSLPVGFKAELIRSFSAAPPDWTATFDDGDGQGPWTVPVVGWALLEQRFENDRGDDYPDDVQTELSPVVLMDSKYPAVVHSIEESVYGYTLLLKGFASIQYGGAVQSGAGEGADRRPGLDVNERGGA